MTVVSSNVRVGLIGFGYWGPNLLRTLSAVPHTSVRTVCDTNAKGLARARASAPWIKVTHRYRDVLADDTIDAVVIATPLASHFEIAQDALIAGKHVFVEKPFTRTSAEATALIDSAAVQGRVLMVDHTYVYSSAIERLQSLLAGDELGVAFYYDSVRANLGRFRDDVDVLWDLAVHDIAILDYLVGIMPVEVSATGANFVGRDGPRASELAYMTLRYASGLLAHIHVNWFSPIKIRRTMIGASRRMVVYDDLEPSEKLKVYDRGVDHDEMPEAANGDTLTDNEFRQRRIGYRSGDMWAPRVNVTEPLAVATAEFARCIRTGDTPRTDGACGRRVVRVLEAASVSLASGGTPVAVNHT